MFRVDAGEICVLSVACLLDSIVFDVVIEAASDVTVKIIPAGVIHRLEAENPKVGLFLYKTATEKFSEVMWTMQQILFMKLDARIAIFLWDEINRIDEDALSVTHDMIANQIGSSREAVTRVMKYFEKEGILDLKRGKVNVDFQMDIAGQYGVSTIPTLMVFEKGKQMKRSVGYMPKENVIEMLKAV